MMATNLAGANEKEAAVIESFRSAMRSFTGTVCLITTCTQDDEWRGMAATAVTSVSMEPPASLVCINRSTTLHPALHVSGHFCINVLHQDQHGLIDSFASSKHRARRFQTGDWRQGQCGLPYLPNAQSNVFCRIFKIETVGTHDVMFGSVFDVKLRDDHDPLLYGQGAYLRQARVVPPQVLAAE